MIPHWVTDATGVAAPIVGLLYFVLQLVVKSTVSDTNSLLKAHIASDDAKHEAFDKHFEFTDRRVDRLEDRKS